jgi:hypothetical protein
VRLGAVEIAAEAVFIQTARGGWPLAPFRGSLLRSREPTSFGGVCLGGGKVHAHGFSEWFRQPEQEL